MRSSEPTLNGDDGAWEHLADATGLGQVMEEWICKARRWESIYKESDVPSAEAAMYWKGFRDALVDLRGWIKAELREHPRGAIERLSSGGPNLP